MYLQSLLKAFNKALNFFKEKVQSTCFLLINLNSLFLPNFFFNTWDYCGAFPSHSVSIHASGSLLNVIFYLPLLCGHFATLSGTFTLMISIHDRHWYPSSLLSFLWAVFASVTVFFPVLLSYHLLPTFSTNCSADQTKGPPNAAPVTRSSW